MVLVPLPFLKDDDDILKKTSGGLQRMKKNLHPVKPTEVPKTTPPSSSPKPEWSGKKDPSPSEASSREEANHQADSDVELVIHEEKGFWDKDSSTEEEEEEEEEAQAQPTPAQPPKADPGGSLKTR